MSFADWNLLRKTFVIAAALSWIGSFGPAVAQPSTAGVAQPSTADMAGVLAASEGIFVDGQTFKITKGKAQSDPEAAIATMGAKEVGPGAIIFRHGDKLYLAEGTPPITPQAMKSFQDQWANNMKSFQDQWRSNMKPSDQEAYKVAMKDFQDLWANNMKNFQDHWKSNMTSREFQDLWASNMKNFQDQWRSFVKNPTEPQLMAMKDFQDLWANNMKNFQDQWKSFIKEAAR